MADGTQYAGSAPGGNLFVLSHPWPRMAEKARARVQASLNDGCGGHECTGHSATLTKRIARGTLAVSAHLQCDSCGRSMCGAISRADAFTWQDYTPWRQELQDAWQARWQVRADACRADELARRAEQEAERERRIAEREGYLEWCRTSPDWHALSDLVMWRCRRTCEACLTVPAEVVHHLTYDLGKLPPAWHLKGVCLACHDRLHADKRGGADEWCPC